MTMTTKQQLKLAEALADFVISDPGESDDFEEQLRAASQGEGPLEAAEGVNGPDWIEKVERFVGLADLGWEIREAEGTHKEYDALFDWLTHNTKGHIYCIAVQMNDSLP